MGVQAGPKLLERKLWGSGPSRLYSLEVWTLPYPSTSTLGSSAGARGAHLGSGRLSGHKLRWSSLRVQGCFWCTASESASNGCLHPAHTALLVRTRSVLEQSFLPCSPHSSIELWHELSRAGTFTQLKLVCSGAVMENQPATSAISISPLHSASGKSAYMHSSQVDGVWASHSPHVSPPSPQREVVFTGPDLRTRACNM